MNRIATIPIAIFAWTSVGVMKVQAHDCATYPPRSPVPTVEFCEEMAAYRFTVVDTEYVYGKLAFQGLLREHLAAWFQEVGVPFPQAPVSVELWMVVPDSIPEATQARAVVSSNALRMLIFLALDTSQWRINSAHLGILEPQQSYPDSFGHRPGSVVAQGINNVAPSEFVSAYSALGLDVTPISGQWWQVGVPVFEEARYKEALMGNPAVAGVTAEIELNVLFEWIAYRQLAFRFAWSQ